ncbi:MAG: Ldh family oxidoreductase [Ruminococcaceae bacterium]|nr:Ldh family oxidoreductase [Oscillospiraceae bacterium]
MAYINLNVDALRKYCEDIFCKRGYSAEDSKAITDVLLTADLYGIESHGVQRLIRYHLAIEEGSIVPDVKPEIIHETPVSAVIDAPRSMGQVVAKKAMEMAIEKAKKTGFGVVCVKGSNHYGIAGYYTKMAADADMIGISMTNTEAIAIPTYGKKAMLGTSPIAVAMPADPVDFWFDAATTVITRGKLEVYRKKELPLPQGWVADENGADCDDANRVLKNIIGKLGGGIFPLGGFSEETGSHKGYGLGIIVELFTAIATGGTTSPHVKNSGNADTSFCLMAIDYGIFGDKKEMKARMSKLLQELRESPKADGHDRIFTHGEKEVESKAQKLIDGVPVNEKTLQELRDIGASQGLNFDDYFTL